MGWKVIIRKEGQGYNATLFQGGRQHEEGHFSTLDAAELWKTEVLKDALAGAIPTLEAIARARAEEEEEEEEDE